MICFPLQQTTLTIFSGIKPDKFFQLEVEASLSKSGTVDPNQLRQVIPQICFQRCHDFAIQLKFLIFLKFLFCNLTEI